MKKTVIGVCGLPCCGKTFLLSRLQPNSKDDFFIIDCDKLAKWVVSENKAKIKRILGVCETKEIAEMIFSDSKAYKRYTQFVWEGLTRAIKNIIRKSKFQTFILDAPLLLESRLTSLCDTVVVFKTKDSLRRKRASSRGWSRKHLSKRDSFFTKTFKVLNQIPI